MEQLKLVPINFNQDANFVNQCLKACIEHLERHTTDNTVLSVLFLEEQAQKGNLQIFKGLVDDEPVGMMILNLFPNSIAEVQAVLLPQQRKGSRALTFLHMMSDYVFTDLKLYKLKALVRRMKKNPAEVIARRVGFKKEGILKGEWNGYTERGDVLILAYLKSDYEKDNAPSGMITEEIKES
jgi:hypothetical protein